MHSHLVNFFEDEDDEDDEDALALPDDGGQHPGLSRFVPMLEVLLIACQDNAFVERFCMEHADLINMIVRQSPILLEGPLQALTVRGRRVLTFENKRAFFRAGMRKVCI